MKKLALYFLLVVLILSFPCGTVNAEENVEEELENSINDQMNDIDFRDFDEFLKELEYSDFGDGIKSFVEDIINGNGKIDLSKLIKDLGDGVLKELTSFFPICLSIILICILSSTITAFSSKIAGNATSGIVKFVCLATITVLLITSVMSAVNAVKDTVNLFGQFINVIFPMLITLLSVLGGNSTVGVFSPYIGILSSLVINGIQNFIIPIFLACLVLSIVGNLTSSVKFSGIRKFLKNFSEWVLGLGFGIFCTLLGSQSIVTSSFDSISVKTTKFALSSYVPILGGYLSEGFDVVLAGSILIKNALGLTGIFIILIITLLPLLKLILLVLSLKLTAGIVESFADSGISDMLLSVASSVKILISVLLGVAFVTFFVLLLMIYTVNAGVI